MKKYIYMLFAATALASCDMDMLPESGTVTEEQKNEVIAQMPERLAGEINALKSGLLAFETISTSTSTYHNDFGYPAICLSLDQSGQDMVSENHGYNWFSSPLMMDDRLATSNINKLIWRTFYYHTKSANDILKTISAGYTEEDMPAEVKNYKAQALANRAFDYLNLVQIYQFTYLGHEEAKAVPMVTENLTAEQQTNNPRASVESVYTQIMEDLNTAITLFEEAGIERTSKADVDAQVAYGLRARANLLMGNWEAAASDAEKAWTGFSPYSIEAVSVPSFADANASSWIWGSIITDQDDVVQTGIINWPSHMCSITGNGYTTGTGVSYSHRRINTALWNQISDTDVRKNWWVDEAFYSELLVNAYGERIASALPAAATFAPFTNVKFGTVSGSYFDTDNSQDWPLMRAEEMILIQAEAMARAGKLGDAKTLLESFVQNFRDPEYTCAAADVNAFVDEVWFQRRIELWGEGFSLFDVLRLKKPLVRIGGGFSGNCTFADIQPESACMIYMIPECETNSNNGIGPNDNNESVIPPTPLG